MTIFSSKAQIEFFSGETTREGKTTQSTHLRQGVSLPNAWHDAMVELDAKFLTTWIM